MFDSQQIRIFLEKALELAQEVLALGNYPIGALIVDEQAQVLVSAKNECKTLQDITAHAEIIGIRNLGSLADKNNGKKLSMFTSLEPCFGCSFFLARTNITHVYSVLKDPHKGGISALKEQKQFANFFDHIAIENNLFHDLQERSRELMKEYFISIGRKDTAAFYGFESDGAI
jgi:tRNA(adenine34) deaminase